MAVSTQQIVEPLLFEDDLANTEVGPAFVKLIGKDGFVPHQLAIDEVGSDILVGESRFLEPLEMG